MTNGPATIRKLGIFAFMSVTQKQRGASVRIRTRKNRTTQVVQEPQLPKGAEVHPRAHHLSLPLLYASNGNRGTTDVPFYMKDGRCLRRINALDILYIEVKGAQVTLSCGDREFTLNASMRAMLLQLPLNMFCMVNRNQAVNVLRIDSVGDRDVDVAGHTILLTPMFRSQLLNMLPILRNR